MEEANREVVFLIALDNDLDMNLIGQAGNDLIYPIIIEDEPHEREARTRNKQFIEVTIPLYTNDLFKEHFRMSRAAFENLVNVLGRVMDHQNDKIDFRKKILFSVWTISKPESFLAVGDRFNFAKSTAHGIFRDVVAALASFMNQYVKFPSEDMFELSVNAFRERSRGLPGVVSAIDGCHVPIKQPEGNEHDYYNRKGFHSIILQGTCDHTGKFIDVFIGMPGRMHDARVLRNSPLHQRLTTTNLLPANLHIIGDSAYPLLKNLMAPFKDTGHLTEPQIQYNVKLSSIRSIIERAFGILKNKFRRLKFLDISDPDFGTNIIAAACVLYNFLLIQQEINLFEELEHPELQENDAEDNIENDPMENTAVHKRNRICAAL